jgi:uncharacterized protein (TIGR02246 family)
MKSALFAALCLLISLPASAQGVKAQIDQQNAKFDAAFNKGDAAAVAALYTPDATVLPPGSDAVHGRAAIQKFWQGAMDAGVKNVTITADTVESYGRAAREIGHVALDAPDAQKQMVHTVGKYVVIWKQTRGGWQIDTDIWNMNK